MSDKPNNPSDDIIPFAGKFDSAKDADAPSLNQDASASLHQGPLTKALGLRPMTPEEDRALVQAMKDLDELEEEHAPIIVSNDSDTRH